MDRKAFLRAFPDQASAREFFERTIWKDGRFCPHCGSFKSWALKTKKVSVGSYTCGDCKRVFTVTTGTPLHSTKLPLIKWLEVIYAMLQSSKGMSSVQIAKWFGVTQKTAWKMGHAVRLLMAQHSARLLNGIVEVDEKYLGGKPRKKHGVTHKRGRGTAKQAILVAAERGGGQVRAQLIQKDTIVHMGMALNKMVAKTAHLMTDEHSAYKALGKFYAKHEAVKHKGAIYAVGDVHNNTAESFNGLLERAKIGVFHWMSKPHLDRYVQEIVFRWNHRGEAVVVPTKSGKTQKKRLEVPFTDKVAALFEGALGKRLRWDSKGGLR